MVHECIMGERLGASETRFALLENNHTSMMEKIDKIENKVDRMEDTLGSLRLLIQDGFSNQRERFQEEKSKTVEEVKKRSLEQFASKNLQKALIWGGAILVGILLTAAGNALVASVGG